MVAGRSGCWGFLSDAIAIMPGVLGSGVSWLRRTVGVAAKRSNGSEVLMDGPDGFDGKRVGCFCTVEDDGFPNSEPIFDVGGCSCLYPSFDILVIVSNA
jgi:hypothetical protein